MESGVNFESCKSAIENFRGAGRRFEFLGTYNGITIADDYAHHPEEIKVTLEAAKEMGYKKLFLITSLESYYEKTGWKFIGKEPTIPGDDIKVYERIL